MELLILLLAAYALTFAAQHKLEFLHKKSTFVDDMLRCTFCTAFHAGWILFLLHAFGSSLVQPFWSQPIIIDKAVWSLIALLLQAFLFGLASSSTSYFLDSFIRWAESNADPIEVEEVEEEEEDEDGEA
jgi:small-conductance mechanosensitive channel